MIRLAALALLAQDPEPSFNRDVRPILSEHCFACHGPDAKRRESGLRLDTREGAAAAIVPGRPEKSGLLLRLHSADREERMPPAGTGKRPTAEQAAVLRRWIAAGAPWEESWSFTRPRRPALPEAAGAPHPVDRFIHDRLRREGIVPAGEASRETLVRRLSLDLTGLPPTPAEVDAFLADASPGAYGRLVDRLLASPRYGERIAVEWLDAARFADTHGLHVDSHRDMSLWRDGVIAAFNANQPFDRFTIEQLAGDLLPDPTPAQRIASGFNRNHMISYQGSSIPEKVRNGYVVDRVNTTGTVWLGLTLGCAQCHDHKFDPVTQEDYYRLYAFFNQVDEKALDGAWGNANPIYLPERSDAERFALLLKGAKKDAEIRELLRTAPNAMVMKDAETPRATHVLERGEYNRPGKRVEAGVPAALPAMGPDLPRNRLGLARWLVDPANPLTARVVVNRYWQLLFGTGLVESSEDFGAQGSWPSHPELLDWLAVEFVESGWDVKAMIRLLATSATYRRSSEARPDLLARDPRNRLLARGPRFRLSAEQIRDQALAAAGILSDRIGGPSVKPLQPPGVWEAVASQEKGKYSAQEYVPGTGEDLRRRSLYTFWKRLAPPPTMQAFDAPSRETCTVRRQRTNTPLQALVTLNDPQFVEAARVLAVRALAEPDPIGAIYRRVLARRPLPRERGVLGDLVATLAASFSAEPSAARSLLSVGESPAPAGDPVEAAAWTLAASAVLNLDEALTRE
jgi:hypothetical protein